MHNDDFLIGQRDPGIVFGYARVIPGFDIFQVDAGQHFRTEFDVGDAGDVEDRHYGAKHGGNVDELDL